MKVRITKPSEETPSFKSGGSFAYTADNVPFPIYPEGINTQSLNPPETNFSVKAVDREDANMEAEKGEILLKGDLSGMFKINGKRHSEGGTPLKADEGDFIFSRDKDLAINKDEKELFGFKQSGKYKKMLNTPAKVLEAEANPKHYNEMSNLLSDKKADDISKRTAELMLGKYQEKIGQVAFLQEGKKGFPTGLPAFALGTAPVKNEDTEEAPILEEQYMRYGGTKFQLGGTAARRVDALPPSYVPPYVQAVPGDPARLQAWGQSLRQFGFMGDVNDPNQIQQWMNENAPDSAPYIYSNGIFGLNNKNYNPSRKPIDANYVRDQFNDGKWREDAWTFEEVPFGSRAEYDAYLADKKAVGKLSGQGDYYFGNRSNEQGFPVFEIPRLLDVPVEPAPASPAPTPASVIPQPKAGLTPNSFTAKGNGTMQDFDIPWNAQEKLSTAFPFLRALMTPTYYDMLQQQHTPDIRLDRISNDQELTDIRQQASLAQREIGANNSGQRGYIAQGAVRQQALENMARSNAQNNNINSQISNQEDMTNYQAGIRDRDVNQQNIYRTFVNNTTSLQRRDENIANGLSKSLSTGLGVQSKLDALKQVLSQSAMSTMDENGNPRFLLDKRTRLPQLNPNWQGDIINNPFIASGSAGTTLQDIYADLKLAIANKEDPKRIFALTNALKALNTQTKAQPSAASQLAQIYGALGGD